MTNDEIKKKRAEARKQPSSYDQGVTDRKNGKGIAHGPNGSKFALWFEGWTAEDERIRKANQSHTQSK